MIRKILYGLGVLVVFLIVGFGIVIFLMARQNAAIDAEAKPYVSSLIAEVGAHLDRDDLMSRMTPELREKTEPKAIDALVDAVNVGLGHLVEFQPPHLINWTSFAAVAGTSKIIANYSVPAKFEKGTAEIEVQAVKIGGKWLLGGFHVNSTDMMRNLAGRKS